MDRPRPQKRDYQTRSALSVRVGRRGVDRPATRRVLVRPASTRCRHPARRPPTWSRPRGRRASSPDTPPGVSLHIGARRHGWWSSSARRGGARSTSEHQDPPRQIAHRGRRPSRYSTGSLARVVGIPIETHRRRRVSPPARSEPRRSRHDVVLSLGPRAGPTTGRRVPEGSLRSSGPGSGRQVEAQHPGSTERPDQHRGRHRPRRGHRRSPWRRPIRCAGDATDRSR